jgi:hypothetical protein
MRTRQDVGKRRLGIPVARAIFASFPLAMLLLVLPIEPEAGAIVPPADISRIVGADTATCTPRGCSYEVTCAAPNGQHDCLFALGLTSQGRFLTRIDECIADEQGHEDCLPEAEGVALLPGETRKLKLRLLGSGRQEVKRLLKKHKRKIKGGGWEAVRADLALAPQNEGEAQAWDAIPGFFTREVLGGWLVFQLDSDTKIRLKR